MLRELWASLCDWRRCGDLVGHLCAWWRVVTGRASAGDRYTVTPAGLGAVRGGQDPDCQGGDRQGDGVLTPEASVLEYSQ
jgi:hypothetical protein